MKITEILSPEMVIPQLRGGSKADVLGELAQALCKGHPEVTFDRLLGVLNERERLGSTAIGDGIAIPHGKLRGIGQILGVFGRSSGGIDFDSLDGNPTQLFFLLVAPEDSASLHLKALARVSRLFKDGAFRQRLLAATDAADLYRLLKEEDSKY
ncbi:MAG TPA: PTS sugar transporter subunit IIA [Candidatus Binataceae bacterium]|nr:PTS sugar transporter subunit IIA [Candidatus Binataceae bacterium]